MATIQVRRATAAEWASANPVLAVGEPGYDTTNKLFKVGDGSTAWSALTVVGGTGGTSPVATTTVTGTVELATNAEVDAGTSTAAIAVNPAGVKRAVDNHVSAIDPHPAYGSAITELQTANENKADLVSGIIPVSQIGADPAPLADTVPLRRTGGQVAVGTAIASDEAVPLAQVLQAVEAAAGPGAEVRDFVIASGSLPVLNASSTTYVTVPTIAVTDGMSAQVWRCSYELIYQATSAAGIGVRFKTGTAAVTNKLPNPSFETNTTGWDGNAITAITRATAGGGFSGSAYGVLTISAAGTAQMYSDFIPTTPGTTWSAGTYLRMGSATPRIGRIDIQFADATGNPIDTDLGDGGVSPTTSGWTRFTNGNAGAVAPSGTTQVRVRVVALSVQAGDIIHADGIQLEPSFPLPAFGSTGGSGASALSITGDWGAGLTIAATTASEYSKRNIIRYPADSTLLHTFGGLGIGTDAVLAGSFYVAIGGTGLSDQRIELEFAQRVTDAANATRIVHADATFARIS